MAKRRDTSTGAVIIEYILAVGLIGMALMGVMRGVSDESMSVADRFKQATGSSEFCAPGDIC